MWTAKTSTTVRRPDAASRSCAGRHPLSAPRQYCRTGPPAPLPGRQESTCRSPGFRRRNVTELHFRAEENGTDETGRLPPSCSKAFARDLDVAFASGSAADQPKAGSRPGSAGPAHLVHPVEDDAALYAREQDQASGIKAMMPAITPTSAAVHAPLAMACCQQPLDCISSLATATTLLEQAPAPTRITRAVPRSATTIEPKRT